MGNRVTILMNIDGSDPKPLCYQWDAHWSPDGRFIAGNINMKDRRKGRPLSVIDPAKLEERIVSPDDWGKYKSRGFSTYTPDGKWICSGNPRFIAVPMDASGMKPADGQKPVTIVRSSGCNQEASPDGKWFTWTVDTHGEAPSRRPTRSRQSWAGRTGPSTTTPASPPARSSWCICTATV